MTIKITKQSAGERLDKFLISRLPHLSRAQIQKLIKRQAITINGIAVSQHCFLKPGGIINIDENFSSGEKIEEEKKPEKNFANKIKIIHETDEFLTINKPAGLAVHKANGPTLADWLVKKYPEIKQVGHDPERPGIVHRLDREASGLMIIAKTQAAFESLEKQFQNREIKKEYTALVHGKIAKDRDVINFPIKRARSGYKMAAMPATAKGEPAKGGRSAETEFQIKQKFINYTLLKIKIKTGRTHQIRVHLSAYGHPIVGDNIYATAKTRTQNKKLGLNRVFLVADSLSFTGLQNNQISFKISLPQELKNILKIIK
ncbi:MAG: RluA family pseudouridine synthase [bacterium]